jgi:tetratricopeptide (TPR) repeat protein
MEPSSKKTGGHDLLIEATALAKSGEYEGAIVKLKELIESHPRHEIALGMLAGIHAQIGMHDRAIENFRRVLKINPENPLARFQLGLSQLSSGQPADALDTWKPSLKNPDNFLVLFHSGLALMQLNRPAEARPLLEEAARRMPKNHALYPQLTDLLTGSPV